MTSFDLFARGREVLGRYGLETAEADRAWRQLAGDFPFAVPDWPALGSAQRQAAERYLGLRAEAARRLGECEGLHRRLHGDGIDTDLVERYAEAREAYEACVEAFGAAREELQAALGR